MLRANSTADKLMLIVHYENTPIQIYWEFYHQKIKTFRWKIPGSFHISAQNIDCGYSLEPPRRGGSSEYPQSMFLSRNKKINVYPCKPQFYFIKVGLKGLKTFLACFRDAYCFSENMRWQFMQLTPKDTICMIFFCLNFFSKNHWYFKLGDNLHEMSNPVLW